MILECVAHLGCCSCCNRHGILKGPFHTMPWWNLLDALMTLKIQFKSSLVRMWLCRVGIAQGETWLDVHYTSHCQARQCGCRLNGIGVRLG